MYSEFYIRFKLSCKTIAFAFYKTHPENLIDKIYTFVKSYGNSFYFLMPSKYQLGLQC